MLTLKSPIGANLVYLMTFWSTTRSFNNSVNTDWFKDKFVYSAVWSIFVNKTGTQYTANQGNRDV